MRKRWVRDSFRLDATADLHPRDDEMETTACVRLESTWIISLNKFNSYQRWPGG